MENILEKEANKLLDALRKSFYDKKMVATGKTVNSLRQETTETGFKIYGGDWIEFAEFGRGQGVNSSNGKFYQALLEWAKAVGFPEGKVRFLQYYINKFGTRLHRGQDPRFPGKTQSGVLTDVLNEKYLENLKEVITFATITDYKIILRNLWEQ